MPAYTRRRLLAGGAAGAAALAGCTAASTGEDGTPSAGPLVIRNRDDESHVLALTLHREGELLIDRSYDIEAGGRQELANPIRERGSYDLEVELGTGSSDSVTWALDRCERIEHVVIVVGEAETIEVTTERETVESPSC